MSQNQNKTSQVNNSHNPIKQTNYYEVVSTLIYIAFIKIHFGLLLNSHVSVIMP